jgi:hypothetical protein
VLLLLGPTGGLTASEPVFPLHVSADGRFLADAKDRPFLYHADTAWMLFLNLSLDEADEYFAIRKGQGFNALQVILTGFMGATNRAGELPFQGGFDFARPNEAFFAHVDEVLRKAQQRNLHLSIAPLWAGCCREGWAGKNRSGDPLPMNVNGPAKCREFGRFLGRRYHAFANVGWILGGDNDPHETREEMRQLALGLKDAAPQHLLTYHASSSHSSTDVWPAEPWLDVSMVYTYFRGFNKAWTQDMPDVYEVSWREYAKPARKPFFLGESTYEGEHDAWGSALQARKQAYWVMLGGGAGHAYGSPNWRCERGWHEGLQRPGALSLRHWHHLFSSRPWWTLEPDRTNTVAVAGQGPFATNDYATTARAADRSFAISYLPSPRPLTLDLSQLSGRRLQAWWFNPRTGQATPAGEWKRKSGDAFPRHTFMPPAEGDWALLVEDARKGYPPLSNGH